MGRVIIDVPAEKMQPLLKALSSLGIVAQPVPATRHLPTSLRQKRFSRTLHRISSSFILFDWEFFSNELEYE